MDEGGSKSYDCLNVDNYGRPLNGVHEFIFPLTKLQESELGWWPDFVVYPERLAESIEDKINMKLLKQITEGLFRTIKNYHKRVMCK